jgi:hypothetical protein
MKKFLLFVLFLGAGAGFYATPYYTAHKMQQAAQSKNGPALNSYIDYPAVKKSLQTSLHGNLSQSLLKNKTDSGMNAFAAMFAAAFVNPLIDVLITPENISLMLNADLPSDLKSTQETNTNQTNDAESEKNDIVTHKYYQDFDHFVIDVADKQSPDSPFRFTFTRQGLLNWKLTGLTIPNFKHESFK